MSKELIEQISEIKNIIDNAYDSLSSLRDISTNKTKVFTNEGRKKLSEIVLLLSYYQDAVIFELRNDELNLEMTLTKLDKIVN